MKICNETEFNEVIMASLDLWFVVFTDGVYCGACRSAMTNALRLSAGLTGMAQVAVVNCDLDE